MRAVPTRVAGLGPSCYRLSCHLLAAAALACASATALASGNSSPSETLQVELEPLIAAAAAHPTQFAVNIPHPVSVLTQGSWEHDAGRSRWHYTLRIPSAISLSLHAAHVRLPASANLTVSTSRATATYTAREIGRDGLWTRPLLGDVLSIDVALDTADAAELTLQIESWQAGYRALGGVAPDHPYYRRLHAQSQSGAGGCVENYACVSTPANEGAAAATLAVVVSNLYQCTGTLLNNTRNDKAPYVLTARHCQTGRLGGGDPDAAARLTVYWDAVTACGTTLGSIYDDTALSQTGATTLVEQQDAWLLRLDAAPVAGDAAYAGWDATGGSFVDGYSVTHALGNDKQYIGWYGQPVLQHLSGQQLQVGYQSTFWGLVNQLGSSGGGASGSALFNPDNRVVGSASLAVLPDGDGSAGLCPAATPAAPAANTVTAQYTALAAVWSSRSDTTSLTAEATLQSFLDPAGTGQLVLSAYGQPPATSTSSGGTIDTATGSGSGSGRAGGGGGGKLDGLMLAVLAVTTAAERLSRRRLTTRADLRSPAGAPRAARAEAHRSCRSGAR